MLRRKETEESLKIKIHKFKNKRPRNKHTDESVSDEIAKEHSQEETNSEETSKEETDKSSMRRKRSSISTQSITNKERICLSKLCSRIFTKSKSRETNTNGLQSEDITKTKRMSKSSNDTNSPSSTHSSSSSKKVSTLFNVSPTSSKKNKSTITRNVSQSFRASKISESNQTEILTAASDYKKSIQSEKSINSEQRASFSKKKEVRRKWSKSETQVSERSKLLDELKSLLDAKSAEASNTESIQKRRESGSQRSKIRDNESQRSKIRDSGSQRSKIRDSESQRSKIRDSESQRSKIRENGSQRSKIRDSGSQRPKKRDSSVLTRSTRDLVPKNDEDIVYFYAKVAKPFVLSLITLNDRKVAALWIKRIYYDNEASAVLRKEYFQVLLYMTNKKILLGTFQNKPDEYLELEPIEEKYKLKNIEKTYVGFPTLHTEHEGAGDGASPVYNVSCSSDYKEYACSQRIPGFGIQMYFAASVDPILNWDRCEDAILPQGTKVEKQIWPSCSPDQDKTIDAISSYVPVEELPKSTPYQGDKFYKIRPNLKAPKSKKGALLTGEGEFIEHMNKSEKETEEYPDEIIAPDGRRFIKEKPEVESDSDEIININVKDYIQWKKKKDEPKRPNWSSGLVHSGERKDSIRLNVSKSELDFQVKLLLGNQYVDEDFEEFVIELLGGGKFSAACNCGTDLQKNLYLHLPNWQQAAMASQNNERPMSSGGTKYYNEKLSIPPGQKQDEQLKEKPAYVANCDVQACTYNFPTLHRSSPPPQPKVYQRTKNGLPVEKPSNEDTRLEGGATELEAKTIWKSAAEGPKQNTPGNKFTTISKSKGNTPPPRTINNPKNQRRFVNYYQQDYFQDDSTQQQIPSSPGIYKLRKQDYNDPRSSVAGPSGPRYQYAPEKKGPSLNKYSDDSIRKLVMQGSPMNSSIQDQRIMQNRPIHQDQLEMQTQPAIHVGSLLQGLTMRNHGSILHNAFCAHPPRMHASEQVQQVMEEHELNLHNKLMMQQPNEPVVQQRPRDIPIQRVIQEQPVQQRPVPNNIPPPEETPEETTEEYDENMEDQNKKIHYMFAQETRPANPRRPSKPIIVTMNKQADRIAKQQAFEQWKSEQEKNNAKPLVTVGNWETVREVPCKDVKFVVPPRFETQNQYGAWCQMVCDVNTGKDNRKSITKLKSALKQPQPPNILAQHYAEMMNENKTAKPILKPQYQEERQNIPQNIPAVPQQYYPPEYSPERQPVYPQNYPQNYQPQQNYPQNYQPQGYANYEDYEYQTPFEEYSDENFILKNIESIQPPPREVYYQEQYNQPIPELPMKVNYPASAVRGPEDKRFYQVLQDAAKGPDEHFIYDDYSESYDGREDDLDYFPNQDNSAINDKSRAADVAIKNLSAGESLKRNSVSSLTITKKESLQTCTESNTVIDTTSPKSSTFIISDGTVKTLTSKESSLRLLEANDRSTTVHISAGGLEDRYEKKNVRFDSVQHDNISIAPSRPKISKQIATITTKTPSPPTQKSIRELQIYQDIVSEKVIEVIKEIIQKKSNEKDINPVVSVEKIEETKENNTEEETDSKIDFFINFTENQNLNPNRTEPFKGTITTDCSDPDQSTKFYNCEPLKVWVRENKLNKKLEEEEKNTELKKKRFSQTVPMRRDFCAWADRPRKRKKDVETTCSQEASACQTEDASSVLSENRSHYHDCVEIDDTRYELIKDISSEETKNILTKSKCDIFLVPKSESQPINLFQEEATDVTEKTTTEISSIKTDEDVEYRIVSSSDIEDIRKSVATVGKTNVVISNAWTSKKSSLFESSRSEGILFTKPIVAYTISSYKQDDRDRKFKIYSNKNISMLDSDTKSSTQPQTESSRVLTSEPTSRSEYTGAPTSLSSKISQYLSPHMFQHKVLTSSTLCSSANVSTINIEKEPLPEIPSCLPSLRAEMPTIEECTITDKPTENKENNETKGKGFETIWPKKLEIGTETMSNVEIVYKKRDKPITEENTKEEKIPEQEKFLEEKPTETKLKYANAKINYSGYISRPIWESVPSDVSVVQKEKYTKEQIQQNCNQKPENKDAAVPPAPNDLTTPIPEDILAAGTSIPKSPVKWREEVQKNLNTWSSMAGIPTSKPILSKDPGGEFLINVKYNAERPEKPERADPKKKKSKGKIKNKKSSKASEKSKKSKSNVHKAWSSSSSDYERFKQYINKVVKAVCLPLTVKGISPPQTQYKLRKLPPKTHKLSFKDIQEMKSKSERMFRTVNNDRLPYCKTTQIPSNYKKTFSNKTTTNQNRNTVNRSAPNSFFEKNTLSSYNKTQTHPSNIRHTSINKTTQQSSTNKTRPNIIKSLTPNHKHTEPFRSRSPSNTRCKSAPPNPSPSSSKHCTKETSPSKCSNTPSPSLSRSKNTKKNNVTIVKEMQKSKKLVRHIEDLSDVTSRLPTKSTKDYTLKKKESLKDIKKETKEKKKEPNEEKDSKEYKKIKKTSTLMFNKKSYFPQDFYKQNIELFPPINKTVKPSVVSRGTFSLQKSPIAQPILKNATMKSTLKFSTDTSCSENNRLRSGCQELTDDETDQTDLKSDIFKTKIDDSPAETKIQFDSKGNKNFNSTNDQLKSGQPLFKNQTEKEKIKHDFITKKLSDDLINQIMEDIKDTEYEYPNNLKKCLQNSFKKFFSQYVNYHCGNKKQNHINKSKNCLNVEDSNILNKRHWQEVEKMGNETIEQCFKHFRSEYKYTPIILDQLLNTQILKNIKYPLINTNTPYETPKNCQNKVPNVLVDFLQTYENPLEKEWLYNYLTNTDSDRPRKKRLKESILKKYKLINDLESKERSNFKNFDFTLNPIYNKSNFSRKETYVETKPSNYFSFSIKPKYGIRRYSTSKEHLGYSVYKKFNPHRRKNPDKEILKLLKSYL